MNVRSVQTVVYKYITALQNELVQLRHSIVQTHLLMDPSTGVRKHILNSMISESHSS